jgi:hypothetical protein
MPKRKLTLTVDKDLVDPMKALAALEKCSLGELTEGLYRKYLHEHREFVKEVAKRHKRR